MTEKNTAQTIHESEEMKTIMKQVDVIGTDFLRLIEDELRKLGIEENDMIAALQFAIIKNMEGKVKLPK